MFIGRNVLNSLAASAQPRGVLTAAVFAALLAGCGQSAAPPAAGAGAAPPPVEVGVVTVTQGSVGLMTELPGRTEASRVAQVRARVAGILQRQLFREGSEVKADQPLFEIDAAPYRATLASAQATLARAEANLKQAQAQADVAIGKAAVQTAQINVGYASVNSPIAGRIGRALVTEGALVGQGEATPLALVQRIDPMFVNITQPVADVLRLRAAIASGKLKNAGDKATAAVRIVLDDGSLYALPAKLLFSDLTVDPSSSQITLRAEVPNPKGTLLPGMYVRARLEQAALNSAILLPQQAVQRSAQGDSVKVVAADGSVSTRAVKVGAAKDEQWVVLEGLQVGEQVVADGFQKLQGKAPRAKPVPWSPPGAALVAPAATPASTAASAARS